MDAGLMQGAKAAPSTEQENVTGAPATGWSVPAKLTESPATPVICVSGGTSSTVHVCAAGLSSRFPAASTARTLNVCVPAAREA
jgi:hypothetical protein